jgi:hypothetical protein
MISLAAFEEIIDASGVAPRIEAVLPIGVRPRQLSVRALLAGMCLTQADGRPAHLTRVHQALTSLPEDDQVRLGIIADWKRGPHQLTYRQTERTFGLVAGAIAKNEPGGLPSGLLQGICDDLLEASIPDQFKDASTSLAVDWTGLESFSRPPPHGTSDCADPEASWGHRKNNLLRSQDELFYGYYLSAGVMMPEENGPAVPEFARRAALSSCRHDPVRAFAPVLTALPGRGIPLGDILDDSGYAHRDAGAWAIPLRTAGAQLVQDLHPHDLFRINFCPFYVFSNEFGGEGGSDYRGWLMAGIPRSVGPVWRLRSMLRSRLASLRLAASRLTSRPWTSPSQPFIRASVMRSRRLWMISARRGRCWGETRSIAQRRQACSCWQDAP